MLAHHPKRPGGGRCPSAVPGSGSRSLQSLSSCCLMGNWFLKSLILSVENTCLTRGHGNIVHWQVLRAPTIQGWGAHTDYQSTFKAQWNYNFLTRISVTWVIGHPANMAPIFSFLSFIFSIIYFGIFQFYSIRAYIVFEINEYNKHF